MFFVYVYILPEMSEEEAIAAIYLLFTACSLSRLFESDPDMAEKLNYAAMRAAQLKAELKAKKIGIPKSPKVGFCF